MCASTARVHTFLYAQRVPQAWKSGVGSFSSSRYFPRSAFWPIDRDSSSASVGSRCGISACSTRFSKPTKRGLCFAGRLCRTARTALQFPLNLRSFESRFRPRHATPRESVTLAKGQPCLRTFKNKRFTFRKRSANHRSRSRRSTIKRQRG